VVTLFLVFCTGAGKADPFPGPSSWYPLFQTEPDTIRALIPDTLILGTHVPDSLAVDPALAKTSENALDAKVDYQSADSIMFDVVNKKVFMFNNAVINYDDINLQAAYIEINFEKNEVYATGMPDSTGKMIGVPVFKQGDQTFKSQVMRYNFRSKKGFIS